MSDDELAALDMTVRAAVFVHEQLLRAWYSWQLEVFYGVRFKR